MGLCAPVLTAIRMEAEFLAICEASSQTSLQERPVFLCVITAWLLPPWDVTRSVGWMSNLVFVFGVSGFICSVAFALPRDRRAISHTRLHFIHSHVICV